MSDLRPSRRTEARWLWKQLDARLTPEARSWLEERRTNVINEERPLGEVFPAVARHVGRDVLDDGWSVDEVARAVLILAFANERSADDTMTELTELYRYGDPAEKLAVLRALSVTELNDALGNRMTALLGDAVRTNDQRLLAVALGPYATAHLDDEAFRQAVLKCVFTGVPLELVDGLPERADEELTRMMSDFAAERTAAGRPVPADIRPYLQEA
jgi:hypothetical protein